MGLMIVGQDGAARRRSPSRGGLASLYTLYGEWILACGLATGSAGIRVDAESSQAVIDAVSRTLPAVVDGEKDGFVNSDRGLCLRLAPSEAVKGPQAVDS